MVTLEPEEREVLDRFAAAALAGELAAQTPERGCRWEASMLNDLAYRCFDIAEAMVRQRRKRLDTA